MSEGNGHPAAWDRLGPWRIRETQTVYENPWIRVRDHSVIHPRGAAGQYGVVEFRNRAIAILPLLDGGEVPLVGQHRFPLDRYSWEIPEGGAPLGEDPLDAAQRELAEETGYRAQGWAVLAGLDISNSVTDETGLAYLAWQLVPGEKAPEPSEELVTCTVAFGELAEMCLDGRVRDALTIATVFTAEAAARRGRLPEAARARLAAGGARL
jgi:ADP-ribose pyrophosphatase